MLFPLYALYILLLSILFRSHISELKMKTLHFPMLLLAFFFPAVVQSHYENHCVYTVYVKTGPIIKSGTDSNISLALGDSHGCSVQASNLRKWGLMGSNHNYFESGNLDIFSGRGACMSKPICRLNLTSDGSGHHPGWFCEYVEVTSTGPHKDCGQTIFYVDRWLVKDNLTAMLDACHDDDYHRRHGHFAKRVVNGKRVIGSYPTGSSAAA